MAWAPACQLGDRLKLCRIRGSDVTRARDRTLENFLALGIEKQFFSLLGVFLVPFLRSSAVVAQGLRRVLCLFGKVSAGAADSHYRSLWSLQFIITLRACIFLQVIRAVLFSRFHFFSAAGDVLKQTETVSDHCRFPYFCPFVARDVASGFSMRNREK